MKVKGAEILIRAAREDDAPGLIERDLELAREAEGTIYAPDEVNTDEGDRRPHDLFERERPSFVGTAAGALPRRRGKEPDKFDR